MVSARNHLLRAIWMETETSIFWSATAFLVRPGISVLKNNGDQTFAAPVYYSLPQSQTVGEVVLSDFDLDGDLDAFATIRGDFDQLLKIMVWRNNGDGTFAAPIEFPTGQGPAGIVIADFTGDGKPDVITANYGASSISILRHNGLIGQRGRFPPARQFQRHKSRGKNHCRGRQRR